MPDPGALIELGVVRGAYGVHGWIRVSPYSQDAAVLRAARQWHLTAPGAAEPVTVKVQAVKAHGHGLIAKWEGFDAPEQADAIKGGVIAVRRADFSPLGQGQWYWTDLIGAQVINRQQQVLGQVLGVQNNGAQDLMQVGAAEGRVVLIPMVSAYVDAIDTAAHEIRVDWQLDWS